MLEDEATTLSKHSHKNILSFINVVIKDNMRWNVLPFYENVIQNSSSRVSLILIIWVFPGMWKQTTYDPGLYFLAWCQPELHEVILFVAP